MPIKTTESYNQLSKIEQQYVFKGLTPMQYIDGVNPVGPPGPVLPPDDENILWYFDASDSSKLTINDGVVTEWESSLASIPYKISPYTGFTSRVNVRTADLNGLDTLDWSNTPFHLTSSDSTAYVNWTMYTVCMPSGAMNYSADWVEWSIGRAGAYINNFLNVGGYAGNSKDTISCSQPKSVGTLTDINLRDSWAIKCVVAGGLHSAITIFHNGTGASMAYNAPDYSTDLDFTQTSDVVNLFGGCPGYVAAPHWSGRVAEIILYNTNHDETTRNLVEAYLNDKWTIY